MAVLGLHAGVHRVSAIESLRIIFVTLLLVRSRTRRKPMIEKFFTQPKTLSQLPQWFIRPASAGARELLHKNTTGIPQRPGAG
jgi:hypothetical protein